MVVYEPIILEERREVLAAKAKDYLGRKYGWLDLMAHFCDFWLNGAYVFRRLCRMSRYGVCSWFVGHCYKHINISFGKPIDQLQPDDIDDFCLAHPMLFKCKLNFKEVPVGETCRL